MHSDPRLGEELFLTQRKTRALAFAAVALAIAWIFAWYWETTASIVAIWYRAETFAHGFVILPIVLWLIWRDRQRLATVPIAPFPVALAFALVAGFGWLVAQLAAVLGGAHFMLVAMVPLAVWSILGTAMLRALAFPLAFLFFAVPFGEFIVPVLIDWTANFTVWAVAASGVPVFREGNEFIIPSGRWSVVEACSGVRYLIASLVVGTLYAYLTYRSLLRRVVFIGISILVPLVANWLRAYMIVMIGHLSSNRLAVGVDHIIYGWLFFGAVMMALFWIAGYWRQDLAATPPVIPVASMNVPLSRQRLLLVTIATLVAVSVWKPALMLLEARVSSKPVALRAVQPANGWVEAPQATLGFKPHFVNPAAETGQTLAKAGQHVGLYVGFFRNQDQHSELVSHHNQLVTTTDKFWRRVGTGSGEAMLGSEAIRVRTGDLRGRDLDLVAWQWYWIDGRLTTSDYVAKAYLAIAKLMGRGDDSAVVVLFTPRLERPDVASKTLADFAREMGASIQAMLSEAERQ